MRRKSKILIPIIVGLVVITIAVVVVLVLITSKKGRVPVTTNEVTVQSSKPSPTTTSKPKEKVDLSNVAKSYSDAASSFAKGLSATKDMEKYLETYVDANAFVACSKIDTYDDFNTVFATVEDEEGEKIVDAFKEMVIDDDTFEVVKMTDVEEIGEDDIFSSTDVTIRNSEDLEATFTFVFYDKTIIVYIEDEKEEPITNHSDEFMNYFDEVSDDSSTTDKDKDNSEAVKTALAKMAEEEKDIFNSKLTAYEGDSKTGAEVKTLLDVINSSNEQFVDTETKFVAVYAEISDFDNSAKLESVSKLASPIEGGKNTEENIQAVQEEVNTLKSKIDSSKNYSVTFEKEAGVIISVTIEDAE